MDKTIKNDTKLISNIIWHDLNKNDYNNKLLKILNRIKKTSLWSNTPETTISGYIRSGKLYKNKFYFRVKPDINITNNP